MKNVGVNSFKLLKNRTVVVVAAFAMLLSIVVPTLAMAAQVTERSIALSSSSVSAKNVTYTVKFTAAGAAGAFIVDFCTSPLISTTCVTPTDFDASLVESTTSGFTGENALDENTVRVTGSIAANDVVTVDLTKIDNPSVAEPIYARIVTYGSEANADLYTSTDLKSGSVDTGSVAIAIQNTIGVSAAVLESMTFCVSAANITTEGCATTTAPVLRLGEPVGSSLALVPGTISTGSLYTQISTNAAGGAVVSLKSSATNCGGLVRLGAANCDILPALKTGISTSEAKFGVKTATAVSTGDFANGTFQPVALSGYNNTTYALNYADQNASGVTSTYGDPFLDTDGKPVNNKTMQLTFGVGVTNATPAGLYSADLGMIATGKF